MARCLCALVMCLWSATVLTPSVIGLQHTPQTGFWGFRPSCRHAKQRICPQSACIGFSYLSRHTGCVDLPRSSALCSVLCRTLWLTHFCSMHHRDNCPWHSCVCMFLSVTFEQVFNRLRVVTCTEIISWNFLKVYSEGSVIENLVLFIVALETFSGDILPME